MPVHHLSLGDLLSVLREPSSSWPSATLVVDLDSADVPLSPVAHAAPWPGVVIGVGTVASPADALCDTVLPHHGVTLEAALDAIDAHPLAAGALVLLLRGSERRSIDDGLLAESAVYSTLQGGPEFVAWRASRPPKARPPEGDAVVVTRSGGEMQIRLTRPHVRNALNTLMRDQLVEAFTLPALDASITEVHLSGDGDAFCAGGDLDEFGSLPDPATAHLVRLQQSVGRRIAAVADRVTAHLHGACMGSGIELPAFAGRVEATPAATFALPELSLGLIPGAGGTVSLPRRIGRHRTARLALTGESIDADTALEWGLVDAVT